MLVAPPPPPPSPPPPPGAAAITLWPPPATEPAPAVRRAPAVAVPWMKGISDKRGSGVGTRLYEPIEPLAKMYTLWCSGSYEPPAHTVAPDDIVRVAIGPSALLRTGGVNSGPILYFFTSS